MSTLPLLERSTEHHPLFRLLPDGGQSRSRSSKPAALVPDRALEPGENYRFHFDMTKCIGCHCCEVACNEQNNLPADLPWRRVGEIEGGTYPFTQRFNLSMGCNHCLEPACLTGCPVEAYTKDPLTGIVLHSTDACIGCQYCTWNCPYGVPQFNPERGVVGKCDMCHGRLSDGQAPACVNACPETAIQIEIVNVLAWRSDFAETANAPGMPRAEATVSTTRITLPASLEADLQKADYHRVRPEHAHIPLVGMTVLIQLSVALFACARSHFGPTAVAVVVGLCALGFSTLHLGRPAFAWRALKMWRRSWLSREVFFLSAYAALSALCLLRPDGALWAAALLTGIFGVYSSARIYHIPARPSWNMFHTTAAFLLTGAILGPLAALCMEPAGRSLRYVVLAAASAQLLNYVVKLVRLNRSSVWELRASGQLLTGPLRRLHHLRIAFAALCVLAIFVAPPAATFLLALAAELLCRYLFFVSVVPLNIASSYLGLRRAA